MRNERLIEALEELVGQEGLGKLGNILYHCFTTSPPPGLTPSSNYVGDGVSDVLRDVAKAIQSLANEKAIANMIELEWYRQKHPHRFAKFCEFLNKQKIANNWPAGYDEYCKVVMFEDCEYAD